MLALYFFFFIHIDENAKPFIPFEINRIKSATFRMIEADIKYVWHIIPAAVMFDASCLIKRYV